MALLTVVSTMIGALGSSGHKSTGVVAPIAGTAAAASTTRAVPSFPSAQVSPQPLTGIPGSTVAPLAAAPPTVDSPVSPVAPGATGTCGGDFYINTDGVCVHRPEQAAAPPAGATAQCTDGTYSFSRTRSGTCSKHGGVARWL
ncbi:DUF3761 domain-containing protein [Nocardia sp. CA-151230]|uniref:DUF3761 domain-containing protein n=1 Tax=Nocardia sp. CA-151230 TaxID=3239982 RepID=UPI003D9503E0